MMVTEFILNACSNPGRRHEQTGLAVLHWRINIVGYRASEVEPNTNVEQTVGIDVTDWTGDGYATLRYVARPLHV